MTLWIIGAVIFYLLSLMVTYACGGANGWDSGIDHMKREAIRVGVAKACDFDGGWRWWTLKELSESLILSRPEPTQAMLKAMRHELDLPINNQISDRELACAFKAARATAANSNPT